MDYAPWEQKQMGSYGEDAGAAYIFSRSAAAEGYVWEQDQARGNHRDFGDDWDASSCLRATTTDQELYSGGCRR